MNYDNALGLKQKLLGENLDRFIPTARMLPRAAIATATPRVSVRQRPPLALGIQGRRGRYRLAVRVQQAHPGVNAAVDYIRRRARGECDVRVVGRVVKQAPWFQSRNRPLRIGSSIGHHGVEAAGTLGCFVHRPGRSDEDLVLSNNHVLANENLASIGDMILQQGPLDGGHRPADAVGWLNKMLRLKKRGNRVDAALASLDGDIEYYVNWLETLGDITGVRREPLDADEVVYKLGRTTGKTRGRVSAIELDNLRVEYDTGVKEFDDQLEIAPDGGGPFSLGGDSGSLIVDSSRRAVGLLFAGNDVDATYVNPIGAVLSALGVELAL
jgi:hypothetical protein